MGKAVSTKSGGLVRTGAGWRGLWRYAATVGVVGLAAALRWGLGSVLGKTAPFITFYPAVAVVGMVAGGRAGLLATGLSAVAANWLFFEPRSSLAGHSLADLEPLGLFVAAGVLISVTAEMLTRARRREWQAVERERAAEEVRRSEKQLEQVRREGEERLRRMEDNLPDSAVCQYAYEADGTPRFLYISTGVEQLNGVSVEEVLRDASILLGQIPPDYRDRLVQAEKRSARELSDLALEVPMRRPDGQVRWMQVRARPRRMPEGRTIWDGVQTDITEHKRAEQERQATIEFLRIVNENTAAPDLIRAAVTFFQQQSGCEAVGIRLRRGEDYPYYEARGFPPGFVLAESSLCARNEAGEILRDGAGHPIHQCMCGHVICGRFDPGKPCFTPQGSFWSNSTTDLLASMSAADRQWFTRSRCPSEGFESVALLALRVGDQRLGLLQLNDRRKGLFSLAIIQLWERLAGYLAVALARVQTEEALRESESRFRAAFEQGAIPMALTVPDGSILRANPAFCRMLGYTEAELRERTFLEITHPEDRAANRAGIQRMVCGEQPAFRMEKRYLCKEGRTIWGDMSTAVARDAQGKPRHLVTHVQNITKRKQAEANQSLLTDVLRLFNRGGDLQQLVREVLRVIRDTAGFDAVGLRLRQGEDCPYYEHRGLSQEFLREENFLCAKGQDAAIVRDAEGRPVLECTCGLVLSGRTDPRMSCFTPGGSFWTNASSKFLALAPKDDPRDNPRNRCIHTGYQSVGLFPVRTGQAIVGLLQLNDRQEGRFTPESIAFYESLAQNIGLALQRAAAEEAVRRAEAGLAQAVRVAGLGTFEHDHRSGVIEYSAVMRELIGFGETEKVTIPAILEKVAPEDREALAAAIRRAHDPAGDGLFEMEHRVRRKDGRIRWVSKRAQTFFEGEGSQRRPMRTIGAALDVTDHKEIQSALERLVAERTARLQETVGELEYFSYTITHDMRAPLRAMQGFGGLLLKTCADCPHPRGQDFIRRIVQSAERMDGLITDALNYSKVVRQQLDLEPVDAGALLRGMIESYPQFQPPMAEVEIAGSFPLVVGNRAGLTQCFSNLLGNAVKFVHPGTVPEVRVWAEVREVDRQRVGASEGGSVKASEGEAAELGHAPRSTLHTPYVRIWFEDNGIGIAKHHQDLIFSMFQRLSKSYEGTGIGLALVRKVVERMKGNVGVESEEGQGSRFWVELPQYSGRDTSDE